MSQIEVVMCKNCDMPIVLNSPQKIAPYHVAHGFPWCYPFESSLRSKLKAHPKQIEEHHD